MKLFKSLNEATEDLLVSSKQMQNALSEIIAEWDSADHPDSFGIMMAREVLEKVDGHPLLHGEDSFREISDKKPSLKQVQKMVGGSVELLRLADGRQLFCDEEGLNKELPLNGRASVLLGGAIFGPVVVLSGDAKWDKEE